jgi:hypothetical protein
MARRRRFRNRWVGLVRAKAQRRKDVAIAAKPLENTLVAVMGAAEIFG